MRSIASVIKGFFASGEAAQRGPFNGVGELGGIYEIGPLEDGWQRHLHVGEHAIAAIPVIEGARGALRGLMQQVRPEMLRTGAQGDVETVTHHPAVRVMRRPNDYETGGDQRARIVDTMLMTGECAVIRIDDDRFAPRELHVLPPSRYQVVVDPGTRALFLAVSATDMLAPADAGMMIPRRNFEILRWAVDPANPIKGVTPWKAAGIAAGLYRTVADSQLSFWRNQRRPSGVMATKGVSFTADQIRQLKAAFSSESRGGMVILPQDVTWVPLGLSQDDSAVIDVLRMGRREILAAIGMPSAMLGDTEGQDKASAEAVVNLFLSTVGGALIEKLERGLELLLGIDTPRERIEVNTTGLARLDTASRIEAITRGIQNGLLTIDEARASEGYGPLPDGSGRSAFLQRQMTPTSLIEALAERDLEKAVPLAETRAVAKARAAELIALRRTK